MLRFRDASGNPVPGVQVSFGETAAAESDGSGTVTFDEAREVYEICLDRVPEGYRAPWTRLRIEGDGFDLTVTLYPDQ